MGSRDSALIPLPNQHGFSARAWLRFSPLQHVAQSWTNSDQWLAPDAQNLGDAFQRLAAGQGGIPVRVAGRSMLSPMLPEVVVPNLAPPNRSQLSLEGELAGRKLRHPTALPSWPHSDILSNTVLQIMVQPDGWVILHAGRALKGIDSYQAVVDSTKYPAVLLTTGVTDPRVAQFHPAKMAARLQAATSSGKTVLLRVDFDAGHGMGSTRTQLDAEAADTYAFILWQTAGDSASARH